MFAFSTLAIAASLAAAVAADHGHDLHARSHHHVARWNLQKRFSGTATYYAVGQGACGQVSQPGDYIVALNSAQYGGGYPGPNCFKTINICAKGKCANAVIMDECPTCGYGSLDLSEGLFKNFASTDDGVFQMTWTFVDGGGDDKPTTTKKPDPTTTWKPEPTTTWKPEPTTTWEPPTTTSTKKKTSTWSPPPETTSTPEPTTTSTSSSSSSTPATTSTSTVVSTTSAAVSVAAASSVTDTSAVPSASASSGSTTGSSNGSGSGSNLADAQQVIIALGRVATAAHQ